MKSIISYKLLFVLCMATAAAQSLPETLAFAQQAQRIGDYSTAIAAYQRASFWADEASSVGVYPALAQCYAASNQPEKSLYYWDIAYNRAPNDSLRAVALLGKVRSLMLARQFPMAQAELYALPELLNPALLHKQQFYQAVLFFEMEKDSLAQAAFHEWLGAGNAAAHRQIDSLFVEARKLSRYKERRAMILSAIFPGLGQAYIGEYGAALNSFILTGGLYVALIALTLRYSPLDALLSLMPWFRRYYVGGYEAAARLAKRKKQQRRDELFNALLDVCAQHGGN